MTALLYFFASLCCVIAYMDKTEDAVIIPGTEVDGPVENVHEKPVSKRQLKLQKRQEQWLTRKAERR